MSSPNNLAADNVIPQQLTVTHPRHRSPHRASMVGRRGDIVGTYIFCDPRNYLYGLIAGIYSYGILFMMTLVSFAMAFLLFKKLGSKSLVGVLLSVVFIVMLSILVFASTNFDLLSGLEGAVGTAVVVLIWLFMLSGYLLASRLRKTKPEVFAKIGREEVQATILRVAGCGPMLQVIPRPAVVRILPASIRRLACCAVASAVQFFCLRTRSRGLRKPCPGIFEDRP